MILVILLIDQFHMVARSVHLALEAHQIVTLQLPADPHHRQEVQHPIPSATAREPVANETAQEMLTAMAMLIGTHRSHSAYCSLTSVGESFSASKQCMHNYHHDFNLG